MILTCNLGSLGLGAVRLLDFSHLRGASLTSRETHGRRPFGLKKKILFSNLYVKKEEYVHKIQ